MTTQAPILLFGSYGELFNQAGATVCSSPTTSGYALVSTGSDSLLSAGELDVGYVGVHGSRRPSHHLYGTGPVG